MGCAGKLRHKAIDFLVQSGLGREIYKLEGDAGRVLDGFDAIADVATARVAIFHIGVGGECAEATPLFRRFLAFLGEKNGDGNPSVYLGLLNVEFCCAALGDKAKIGLLFCESPLRLNAKHGAIPNCELLFVVTPVDERLWHIWCQSKNAAFWCNVLQKRVINGRNLSYTLAVAVFQYVTLSQRDLLFAKDDERREFLARIQKIPVSNLDLVNGFALDALGH
jgi:hypothetical protein